MTLHLSFLLWLPAVAGLIALFLSGRIARWVALLGSLGALAYAIALVVDFEPACSTSRTRRGSSRSGSTTSSASTG
jgi:NADH:ubiquinone oxidoreductase subunit 4 (subunit M)